MSNGTEPNTTDRDFKGNPFYRPPLGSDVQRKESSIPADAPVWGELFVDESGLIVNFRFHVEKGVGFDNARTMLRKFIITMQQRLDRAQECPFYEDEINELARANPNL